MKKNNLVLLSMIGAGLLLAGSDVLAFAPSTGFRSYDQALRTPARGRKKYHVRVVVESSIADQAYNSDSKRSNALAIYDKDQSSLMALRNPLPDNRAAADIVYRRMANPADDGVRGHMLLNGSYSETSVMPTIGASIELDGLPGKFGVDVHVPIVRKQMSLSLQKDQTNTTNFPLPLADLAVSAEMPNMLENIRSIGGLSLEKWTASGLGDASLLLTWRNWFKQEKELVRGVGLFAHVGVSLPSGKERDEDQMLSMPLGADGAFGIPVGVGMRVQFVNTLQAGLCVDFVGYFDKTKVRRLKTLREQTNFFLLNKGLATRDSGLNWQFYLYLKSHHLVGGLSLKAAYQYLRHDSDKLSPRDNKFSYDIVNSSNTLQEWHAHNVILSADYDHKSSKDRLVTPQMGVFYKLPVGGKAVIAMQSVGVHMGARF